MSPKLNCILLIDDNPDDNFFHTRVINKLACAEKVIAIESAVEALHHLRSIPLTEVPDLVLLDINMPGMNGWEFLEEYARLEAERRRGIVIVLLTTSHNPDDEKLARSYEIVCDFKIKPLTESILKGILQQHFGVSC
ncbi:MAG: response regulator [Chitinophagales bacterium]